MVCVWTETELCYLSDTPFDGPFLSLSHTHTAAVRGGGPEDVRAQKWAWKTHRHAAGTPPCWSEAQCWNKSSGMNTGGRKELDNCWRTNGQRLRKTVWVINTVFRHRLRSWTESEAQIKEDCWGFPVKSDVTHTACWDETVRTQSTAIGQDIPPL